MDDLALDDYYVKTTVIPNYSYFMPAREYVPVWKDYDLSVKLELVSSSDEIAAIVLFNAVPFNLIDDMAITEKLCQQYRLSRSGIVAARNGIFVRLNRLFVTPEFRRQGLASAILKKFPEIMARQNGWKIKLMSACPVPFEGIQKPDGSWEIASVPCFSDDKAEEELLLLYFNSGFTTTHNDYYWHAIKD